MAATPNTNSVVEGGEVTGNVLTDGTRCVRCGRRGDDGSGRRRGGVAAGSDTTAGDRRRREAPINWQLRRTDANADGTYTYYGNANAVVSCGRDGHVRLHDPDGDGDTSTMTLTITLTDSGLRPKSDRDGR